MGRNKAFLELHEKPFIEIAIEVFKNFDEVIIISNNEELYSKYNIKVYNDIIKNVGPIGGIYTALEYAKYDIVIVACDMPYLNSEIVERIANEMDDKSMISVTNGKLQPLCSGYKKSIINKVSLCIEGNDLKLRSLIDKIDKSYIYFDDEDLFLNVNTVNEYKKLTGF
ncbi:MULTISPECIES: molybdenum cofactor guanylyltransferase [unclassified Clostridioides]|uniref:molybdenum cofactor guanylyltransferase n=1 Tax=unclassified Clostridioides TaxID=2635829 RepID=UPI0038ADB55F